MLNIPGPLPGVLAKSRQLLLLHHSVLLLLQESLSAEPSQFQHRSRKKNRFPVRKVLKKTLSCIRILNRDHAMQGYSTCTERSTQGYRTSYKFLDLQMVRRIWKTNCLLGWLLADLDLFFWTQKGEIDVWRDCHSSPHYIRNVQYNPKQTYTHLNSLIFNRLGWV